MATILAVSGPRSWTNNKRSGVNTTELATENPRSATSLDSPRPDGAEVPNGLAKEDGDPGTPAHHAADPAPAGHEAGHGSAWDLLRSARVHPDSGAVPSRPTSQGPADGPAGHTAATAAGAAAASHAKGGKAGEEASAQPRGGSGSEPVARAAPGLSEVAGRLAELMGETEARAGRPSQWCMMGCMLGWEETARRAVNELTTVGVISALLAGISYPALLSPPTLDANPFTHTAAERVSPTTLLRLMSYGLTLSIMFSIACVILCAMIIMQLNITTTPDDIRGFFVRYEWLMGVNMISFCLCLVCISLTVVAGMAINFHLTDTLVVLVVAIVAWAVVGGLVAYIYLSFSLHNLERHHRQLMEVTKKLEAVVPPGSARLGWPFAKASGAGAPRKPGLH